MNVESYHIDDNKLTLIIQREKFDDIFSIIYKIDVDGEFDSITNYIDNGYSDIILISFNSNYKIFPK
jgi:hypothetical protein